jgi:hypothetical protein
LAFIGLGDRVRRVRRAAPVVHESDIGRARVEGGPELADFGQKRL